MTFLGSDILSQSCELYLFLSIGLKINLAVALKFLKHYLSFLPFLGIFRNFVVLQRLSIMLLSIWTYMIKCRLFVYEWH